MSSPGIVPSSSSSRRSKFVDSEVEASINELLQQQPVDLRALRRLSRKPGGFQSHLLRIRVWPKLLGVNRFRISDYRGYIQTEDDIFRAVEDPDDPNNFTSMSQQVRCDVERSLWSKGSGASEWKEDYRERRRKTLAEIILATLGHNPGLHYFQGFHDVVSVVMLIFEEDHLSFEISEALAKHFMIDYMREDFDIVSKFMHFVLIIIKQADRELYDHLEKAKLEPFFATSWLITWFAHDIGDTEVIARVFDALLSSPPIFCYYISAAFVIHIREILLNTESDFAALHNVLVRAPEKYGFPFEALLVRADQLYKDVPPKAVLGICSPTLLALIQQSDIHVLSKDQFLPNQVDCDRYLLEKMELSKGYMGGENYPLLRHYARRVMVGWGWTTTFGTVDAEVSKNADDPLHKQRQQQLNTYRAVVRSSLFWSITVAIGGILGYALFYKSHV